MFPQSQSTSQPPSSGSFGVVHVSSLEAALANLKIDIPIEDLLEAVRDVEDEARQVRLNATATAGVEAEETRKRRRAALSTLALQPSEPTQTAGLKFTTVSRFVPNPAKAAHVDPLAKERRRCLLELTEEAFPNGKVSDPFVY